MTRSAVCPRLHFAGFDCIMRLMEKKMEKLKLHTPDLADENFRALAALFPNAVTEAVNGDGEVVRAIDADVLRQEISAAVVEGPQERYRFTWPDKRKAVALANAPISKTLRLDRARSAGRDGTPGGIDTENLYIEGDNLDALKLLLETYLGKVRIIYIDPPYNTGSDLVYADDFSQSAGEYLENSGQLDEAGNRLVRNIESGGRFHTSWLNMLYPRLRLAKELLSDDGVIFISIDDNEVCNLRKICDEIFGAANYMNQLSWVSNITGRQIAGYGAAKTWESILVYAKNTALAGSLSVDTGFARSRMPDAYKGLKKDIRTDARGAFAVGDTLYNHNRIFNEETRPNLVFSIFYNPDTGEIATGEIGERRPGFAEIPPHRNADGIHKYHAWRWSRRKIADESHDLIVLPGGKGYEVYTRIRDFDTTLLKDIITNIPNGDKELKALFDNKRCFDYPKSVDLLSLLIGSIRDRDAVVLDFFSGSATTAHAVMRLNLQDGGHRKFIMVQLPELCGEKSDAYKTGYRTICEIGEERIRRAGRKLRAESPEAAAELDVGFRVLRVDSGNMKDVCYSPEAYSLDALPGMADNIKEDRGPEDLLFQVMLDLGILLSSKIEETGLAGKRVFSVADGRLMACFDSDVGEETVRAIARRQPDYAVFRDSGLGSDSVAASFDQIFETYSPGTTRKVL